MTGLQPTLADERRVRLNRIDLWVAMLLDPERDELLTPLRPIVEALAAEARAATLAATEDTIAPTPDPEYPAHVLFEAEAVPNTREAVSSDLWECPYKGMPHPAHNLSQGWACPGEDR